MSRPLTSSQRVVAKEFRQKFPLSSAFDQVFIESIERFIVDFDNRVTPLNSMTAMDFVNKYHHGNKKEHSVEIRNILCALCVFMTCDLATILSLDDLKAHFSHFPEFAGVNDSEWDRLLKYHSIVQTCVGLFGTEQQKGRVLFVANHLVGVEDPEDPLRGQKFSTGSGASKATKRRAIIYQTISGVTPKDRKKRALEDDNEVLPDSATDQQRRELAEALAKIAQIKRACIAPPSSSSSSSAPTGPVVKPIVAPAPVIATASSSASIPVPENFTNSALSFLCESLSCLERSNMEVGALSLFECSS